MESNNSGSYDNNRNNNNNETPNTNTFLVYFGRVLSCRVNWPMFFL